MADHLLLLSLRSPYFFCLAVCFTFIAVGTQATTALGLFAWGTPKRVICSHSSAATSFTS